MQLREVRGSHSQLRYLPQVVYEPPIPPMVPTVPLANYVRASEGLQFRWPLNPNSTLDGFEAASILELPTDSA
jgi:hypothetical protein